MLRPEAPKPGAISISIAREAAIDEGAGRDEDDGDGGDHEGRDEPKEITALDEPGFDGFEHLAALAPSERGIIEAFLQIELRNRLLADLAIGHEALLHMGRLAREHEDEAKHAPGDEHH